MTITVKKGDEPVWMQDGVKHATIYSKSEEDSAVVIEGWFEDVPNGYFVQSFDVNNFDRITLEEE